MHASPKQRGQWNYELLLVQSIAILAMILGHTGPTFTPIGAKIFPYYSWHMPLFVFISGFLFSDRGSYRSFLKRKTQRLLLPALAVRTALTGLALLASRTYLHNPGLTLSLKGLLINPFLMCDAYPLSNAMWFIFQLYVLEIIYGALIRLPLRRSGLVWLSATLLISLGSLYYVHQTFRQPPEGWIVFPLRTAFLLFFLAAGHMFQRLDQRIRWNPWVVFVTVFTLQTFYVYASGHEINFSAHSMDVINVSLFFMPIVTTLTAAAVLFSAARILSPILQGSAVLRVVGGGTKYIVYFHELCLLLINCLYMVLCHRTNMSLFDGFSYGMLRAAWYAFPLGGSNWGRIPYVVVSIALPVLLPAFISRMSKRWQRAALWLLAWLACAAYLLFMGRYAHEAVGLA
ncbi:MAG: acyltransferase [Clostridia bacterium]|nr:acyltransferase [Clostridia bacterium]